MSKVTVGLENNADIEIYYQVHGTGQPVVLDHGYPLDGNSWEEQRHVLLEAGYRVITHDRRGFGAFSQYAIGYHCDTFAADLPKIDVPTLIIHGNADHTLSREATAACLPGLIRDHRFVTIDGGPHNGAWTHADEVSVALLAFLKGQALIH